jgi:choline dehydrogenase-like flavoprotein
MHNAHRSGHDVVIVGGRVAGSAIAMLLARLGHDVAVVDRASFPSDTSSTHSIARSGAVQFRRGRLLDVVLDSGAPAIRQVTFHVGGESVRRVRAIAHRPTRHKPGIPRGMPPVGAAARDWQAVRPPARPGRDWRTACRVGWCLANDRRKLITGSGLSTAIGQPAGVARHPDLSREISRKTAQG